MSRSANHFNHILRWENQVLWLSLAFHAGYLNAGGFLASHRFVSHMTGFGTSVGINLSLSEFAIASEMILAPISFICGAAFAGYLIDRSLERGKEPKVLNGIICIIILNAFVFFGGINGFFGGFGEPLLLQRDFFLMCILTFLCGLQNGLFVTVTSGQIRTTHITGLTTDFGLNLVKIRALHVKELKKNEKRKNRLRMKTILSFSIGSLISALIFLKLEYWGFLISTLLSLVIFFYVKFVIMSPNFDISMTDSERVKG